MIVLILVVIALIVAAIDLIRTRGQSLPSWGVLALALALLLGRVF